MTFYARFVEFGKPQYYNCRCTLTPPSASQMDDLKNGLIAELRDGECSYLMLHTLVTHGDFETLPHVIRFLALAENLPPHTICCVTSTTCTILLDGENL